MELIKLDGLDSEQAMIKTTEQTHDVLLSSIIGNISQTWANSQVQLWSGDARGMEIHVLQRVHRGILESLVASYCESEL